jgi:hypothetical protein
VALGKAFLRSVRPVQSLSEALKKRKARKTTKKSGDTGSRIILILPLAINLTAAFRSASNRRVNGGTYTGLAEQCNWDGRASGRLIEPPWRPIASRRFDRGTPA